MSDVQVRTTLPAAVSTPAAARDFVRRAVSGVRDPLRIEDLTIVVSELVTNAVLHGTGDVTLHVVAGDERVHVEVGDDQPAHDLPADPERTDSGRGLLLVSKIASDWGVRRSGAGKVVWADVGVS
jgi:anti-sigma regulatory factor (Ser/Thr protein kinase)